jgi:hypothetical protein
MNLFEHEVAPASHRFTAVVKRESDEESCNWQEIDDPVIVETSVVAPGQHLQKEVGDTATKCPDANSGGE